MISVSHDIERRAVFPRQLSFLFSIAPLAEDLTMVRRHHYGKGVILHGSSSSFIGSSNQWIYQRVCDAHGQCDARPAVTFPATQHHRTLSGTKLYCLVHREAHDIVCEQLAQSRYVKSTLHAIY